MVRHITMLTMLDRGGAITIPKLWYMGHTSFTSELVLVMIACIFYITMAQLPYKQLKEINYAV